MISETPARRRSRIRSELVGALAREHHQDERGARGGADRRREHSSPRSTITTRASSRWRPRSIRRRRSCMSSTSSSPSTRSPQVFFTAMENAVKRGVTVRLLADHLSSRKVPNSKATFAELDRIGVKWAFMLPVMPFKGKYQRPDLRNHRKLRGRRRARRVRGLAEPDRPQLQLAEEHQARPAVAGADHPGGRAGRRRRERRVPQRLVSPRPTSSSWSERVKVADIPRRDRSRRAGLPGRAERTRLRGREQPAALPRPAVLGPGEGHHHEPVLRAQRGDDVRDHRGTEARARRAAVRVRDRGSGARVPRAAVVLPPPARSGVSRSGATRPRTSCTPSTSRSTTTSP